MKVFFLTLSYPTGDGDRNLYSDLMDEISAKGHSVTVFCPDESRTAGHPHIERRRGIDIILVPTGKVTKARLIEKTVNTLLLGRRFARAALAVCPMDIDLLIYSTPPIDFIHAVQAIKRRTGCTTYLLLKDIFPQNAVDLGIIRKGGLAWRFFRAKEKRLYGLSDHIGCMSPANVEYCAGHNPEIPRTRLHVCPNSINPAMDTVAHDADIAQLSGIGIRPARFHLLYGGNLGRPQCIDFVIEALTALDSDLEVFTTIIGNGTEYQRLADSISKLRLSQVLLLPFLPKDEYRRMLAAMDVGLVFLDPRFTIPNFPSRILDYMDCSIPILACTDITSDIRTEICDQGGGVWCKSGDINAFMDAVAYLKKDAELRRIMGKKANELLRTKYSVRVVAEQMLKRLGKDPGAY